MKAKQITAFLMTLTLIFSTAACGKDGGSDNAVPEYSSEQSTADESDVPGMSISSTTEIPVVDDVHVRVEGDTLYVSGTGTVKDRDLADYNTFVNVVVEEGITKIDDAFESFKLESIILPDSLEVIGDHAFRSQNLTSITLPDNIRRIGAFAFAENDGLTSITLPKGLEEIGGFVFQDCNNLTSITVFEGIKTTWSGTFSFCGITSITLPDSLEEIALQTFMGCKNLTSVTLPDNLKRIGQSAFVGCENLTSITLPESLEEIEPHPFLLCPNLTIKAPKSMEEMLVQAEVDLSIVEWY